MKKIIDIPKAQGSPVLVKEHWHKCHGDTPVVMVTPRDPELWARDYRLTKFMRASNGLSKEIRELQQAYMRNCIKEQLERAQYTSNIHLKLT